MPGIGKPVSGVLFVKPVDPIGVAAKRPVRSMDPVIPFSAGRTFLWVHRMGVPVFRFDPDPTAI
jgi:hypothetical protein